MKSPIAIALFATLLAAGCGHSKDKGGSAPAPQEKVEKPSVATTSADGGATTRVTYTSTTKDVKFKCMLEIPGQTGTWADCPADGQNIPALAPGMVAQFKVKAVSASGTESPEGSVIVQGPAAGNGNNNGNGNGNGNGQQQAADLVTEILGKSELTNGETDKTTLTLNFGVSGGESAAAAYRFMCKIDAQTSWGRCPGGDQHTFMNMKAGEKHTLTVQAIDRNTGAAAAEDTIQFAVKTAALAITGEDQLKAATSGTIALNFNAGQIAGLQLTCSIDGGQAVPCTNPYNVNIDQLAPGQHSLSINGYGQSPTLIPFCRTSCQGGPVGGPTPALPAMVLVGDSMHFTVPPTMHINSYSTYQTLSSRLQFYQIVNDPYYDGIYNCANPQTDRPLTLNGLPYCQLSPSGDFFDWLTQRTVAPNHVEVSTNPDLIVQNPQAHDRMVINQFDDQYQFNYTRSRFSNLCRHVRETITVTPRPIELAGGFYFDQDVYANFMSCYAPVAGMGPDVFQAQPGFSGWWVGVFYVVKDRNNLPTVPCFQNYDPYALNAPAAQYADCKTYTAPALIEVVFMSRKQFAQPAQFAQYVQSQIRPMLNEIR